MPSERHQSATVPASSSSTSASVRPDRLSTSKRVVGALDHVEGRARAQPGADAGDERRDRPGRRGCPGETASARRLRSDARPGPRSAAWAGGAESRGTRAGDTRQAARAPRRPRSSARPSTCRRRSAAGPARARRPPPPRRGPWRGAPPADPAGGRRLRCRETDSAGVATPRAASAPATASMNRCRIPAPAPWASTYSTRASGGRVRIPDTRPIRSPTWMSRLMAISAVIPSAARDLAADAGACSVHASARSLAALG